MHGEYGTASRRHANVHWCRASGLRTPSRPSSRPTSCAPVRRKQRRGRRKTARKTSQSVTQSTIEDEKRGEYYSNRKQALPCGTAVRQGLVRTDQPVRKACVEFNVGSGGGGVGTAVANELDRVVDVCTQHPHGTYRRLLGQNTLVIQHTPRSSIDRVIHACTRARWTSTGVVLQRKREKACGGRARACGCVGTCRHHSCRGTRPTRTAATARRRRRWRSGRGSRQRSSAPYSCSSAAARSP